RALARPSRSQAPSGALRCSRVRSERRSVRVDDVDAYGTTTDRRDDLAQRLGGAATAADHRTEVLRVHPDLETLATARVDEPDTYVVRVIDDALDQVFERWPERVLRPCLRRRHRSRPRSGSQSVCRSPRRRWPREPRWLPERRWPRGPRWPPEPQWPQCQ